MSEGRLTIVDIQQKKKDKQKITMLTAYDFPMAQLMDLAGVDMLLVGDSLANVVLGLESTREVGMSEMLHHASAVARASKHALVVGDMPYIAYQPHPQAAIDNAKQFIDIGCQAVKLEWFEGCDKLANQIVRAGVPTIGHVGLTPQTAEKMKVQGKDAVTARQIMTEAKKFQDAGCFAIVIECVPTQLGQMITEQLTIPTIGIGAGAHCDGQVLVSYDVLGLITRYQPKFSKQYVDLTPLMTQAFKQYVNEVKQGTFPDDAHSFHMPADEARKIS